MKISLLSIMVSIFAFAAWYMFFGVESYFVLWPSIDTQYSKHYSEKNFNKITMGMSEDDVNQLMGEPLRINRHYESNTVTYYYSSDGRLQILDFAWLGRFIIFKDGKVSEIHKVVYED